MFRSPVWEKLHGSSNAEPVLVCRLPHWKQQLPICFRQHIMSILRHQTVHSLFKFVSCSSNYTAVSEAYAFPLHIPCALSSSPSTFSSSLSLHMHSPFSTRGHAGEECCGVAGSVKGIKRCSGSQGGARTSIGRIA